MMIFRKPFQNLLIIVSCISNTAAAFVVAPKSEGRLVRPTHLSSSTAAVEVSDDLELVHKRRHELKKELIRLGEQSNRGFRASAKEREDVRKALFQLASLNPTKAPARAYFESSGDESEQDQSVSSSSSLKGKWTLIYTDAPDITGLQVQNGLAELGRIGQECDPPTITNVIEWMAPSWIRGSEFLPAFIRGKPQSSSDNNSNKNDNNAKPRILQKVVTKGTASPDNPSVVKLSVAGFKFQAPPRTSSSGQDFPASITEKGLLAASLEKWPVDVGIGPAPFGEFELLYLDDDMRITRTGQGYFAINVRINEDSEEAWF